MKSSNEQAAPSIWAGANTLSLILLLGSATLSTHGAASNSIARVWNERTIAAIRIDRPHPPVQARNYFSVSVCMYDAWAAYDPTAVGYVYRQKHIAPSGDIAAARSNAISYAAFRMLLERHAYSQSFVTASNSLLADTNLMLSLGYDPTNNSLDTSTPTGVGNAVYAAVSAWFINDGSRQTNGTPYPANPPVPYPDYPVGNPLRYTFVNTALATSFAGIQDTNEVPIANLDVNHWQRLFIQNATNQAGYAEGSLQGYLGVQWLGVRPFSLMRTDSTRPWIDPGPPPFFGGPTHAQFVNEIVAVITADSQMTPDDGATIDISPGANGNNSLDFAGNYGDGSFNIYDGHGYTNNPVTGQPYAPNIVKRGDYSRVLAEFWADGPNSETPPGHWNVLANGLADNPLTVKKIGGVGPVVDDLEWDVKVYFALNAAVHDAACECWATKRYYNSYRPFTCVRYLGGLGQSSNPSAASYNSNGLPLITNIIELVTPSSVASGRHAGLTPGKIALLAWPGPPTVDPVHNHSGVKWIHADNWSTYQLASFVTPAFPGYFSGHSTFSRSAAEVLAGITGSPYFPGGLGTFSNYNLKFENGPSAPLTLQWASYYDAADQAGISRIWGGIHPPIDNLIGRRIGAQVGKDVWALAKRYFDGSVTNTPVSITLRNSGKYEVDYTALRGFYYDLQSTPDITQPFASDPPGTSDPFNASVVARTNNFTGPRKFFRAVSRSTP